MNVALLTKIGTSALLASALSLSAHAEVINTDWKSAGDNLVITDTVTGLEFLKLTETTGMSYTEVFNQINTTYAGWSFSSSEQITSMLSNLLDEPLKPFGGYASIDKDPNTINFNGLLRFGTTGLYFAHEILGYTEVRNDKGVATYSYGNIKTANQVVMYGLLHIPYDVDVSRVFAQYGRQGDNNLSTSNITAGLWLVRDAQNISESPINNVPAPLALSSLALLSFGLVRRKKKVI
jgi:hypothetical protein